MKITNSIKTLAVICIGSMIAWFTTANSFGSTQYINTVTVPWALGNTSATAADDYLVTNIIQTAINWVLGALAMIVLVLLLWWGFQMITAAGDEEKYGAGFTILKQAALGLVFIGLSRFIVSMIFFLIGWITQ